MPTDLDKSPSTPFDLVYEGPTIGWQKIYGGGGGGGGTSDYWVNAKDFSPNPPGFGQGFQDDGIAIQAAIDFAFSNGVRTVRIPAGSYCPISRPIWLAPPGSYNSVDPLTGGSFSQFQFSMALIGQEMDGDGIYNGVTIEAYGQTGGVIDFGVVANYPAIISGPGQGMRIVGLNVRGGNGSLFPTTFPDTTIGIAISGGPGGASRTVIERCWIQNAYTGIRTGWNEDSLGDSNTFIKCVTANVYYGLDIFRTQNYINNVWDCNFTGVVFIRSDVGKAVNVWGGNYSHAGNTDQDFNISSTSALMAGPNATMQVFDTTLSFPGIGLGELDIFSKNALTDGGKILYNCAAIETTHFGVIPLQPVSFNATTNVMRLQIANHWLNSCFGFNPDFSTTDLEAEIQAATLLMMAVRRIAFEGTGIHARGVHLESPNAVSCLVNQTVGFQGDNGCTVDDLYCNWDPPLDCNTSQKKLMSWWPWIDLQSGNNCVIRGGQWGSGEQLPFLFSTNGSLNFKLENMAVSRFNLATYGNFFGNIDPSLGDASISPIRGFGIYPEKTPFVPKNNTGHGFLFVKNGLGKHPHKGVVPDDFPALTQAYADTVQGTLPAKGDYPPLFGNKPYTVIRTVTPTTTPYQLFLISNHDFYSYGQNFNVNWSYKGQSHHLYVDDISWFFLGLKFGIDNGSGVKWYVVIQIHPNPTLSDNSGYLIVHGYDNTFSPTPLFGNKTTVFTGSVIQQEPYNIRLTGGPGSPITVLTDAATIAVDLSTGIDFKVTLGGNRTLGNPTKTMVGQNGTIEIIQDGTGGRTLAFAGNYKFQSASAPSLDAGIGAKTILNYWVEDATNIWISGGYQPSTSNSMQTALVTSQFDVTNNNTLADVPGLSATLLANRKYRGRAVLYTNVNATPGMKVGMSGTAGINASNFFAHAVPFIGGATISNGQLKTGSLGQITSGNSAFNVITIDYFIDVSTAGTLTIQFSQGTSGGTTVSVLVGSNMVTSLV